MPWKWETIMLFSNFFQCIDKMYILLLRLIFFISMLMNIIILDSVHCRLYYLHYQPFIDFDRMFQFYFNMNSILPNNNVCPEYDTVFHSMSSFFQFKIFRVGEFIVTILFDQIYGCIHCGLKRLIFSWIPVDSMQDQVKTWISHTNFQRKERRFGQPWSVLV